MQRNLCLSLITILIMLLCQACQPEQGDSKLIEGDLYYSFFRIGSLYNQPDSIAKKWIAYADTADRKHMKSDELRIVKMYETLKKESLLYYPFIDLKLDNDSIVKLYLKKEDYQKIVIFKRNDLLASKRKVRIQASVKELGLGMALCANLISANAVEGETSREDKKFAIEDYR